jgi:hypothetical protein
MPGEHPTEVGVAGTGGVRTVRRPVTGGGRWAATAWKGRDRHRRPRRPRRCARLLGLCSSADSGERYSVGEGRISSESGIKASPATVERFTRTAKAERGSWLTPSSARLRRATRWARQSVRGGARWPMLE